MADDLEPIDIAPPDQMACARRRVRWVGLTVVAFVGVLAGVVVTWSAGEAQREADRSQCTSWAVQVGAEASDRSLRNEHAEDLDALVARLRAAPKFGGVDGQVTRPSGCR